jgi:hypothetical protein
MTRKDFLIEFLGALGAKKLIFLKFEEDRVSGTAVFDSDDPDEHQDFCWHSHETSLPSKRTYNLVRLIHEQNLLEIDKIRIQREELRERYNTRWKTQLSTDDFAIILDELETVDVSMVDGKDEYDAFFIHE